MITYWVNPNPMFGDGTLRKIMCKTIVTKAGGARTWQLCFPVLPPSLSSIYLGLLPTEKMWQTMMKEGEREEIGKLYASRPWFDLSAEDQACGDDRFRGCLTLSALKVFHV